MLNVLSFATDFLPDDHPHPVYSLEGAGQMSNTEAASLLSTLVPAEGAAASHLPDWLVPLLLDLLRRFIIR